MEFMEQQQISSKKPRLEESTARKYGLNFQKARSGWSSGTRGEGWGKREVLECCNPAIL
jgi:hypothetical protein